ncbi:ATPase component CbiO, partial [Salmonella enterica subsp. enterica serovar Adelaide str. A4-669]
SYPPQVQTVFQDPEQQIFYTDIDSDIAFSLRNLGVPEAEITRRVDEAEAEITRRVASTRR